MMCGVFCNTFTSQKKGTIMLSLGELKIHLGGSLVGLMADSRRAHAKEYFPEPELLLPVALSLW